VVGLGAGRHAEQTVEIKEVVLGGPALGEGAYAPLGLELRTVIAAEDGEVVVVANLTVSSTTAVGVRLRRKVVREVVQGLD
jgi:hypothetical protein